MPIYAHQQYLHSLLSWAKSVKEEERWRRGADGSLCHNEDQESDPVQKLIQYIEQALKEAPQALQKTDIEWIHQFAQEIYQERLGMYQEEIMDDGDHGENGHKQKAADQGTVIPLQPVPVGGHRLPPLPYAYDALEPYIDQQIMRLHHDQHHRSYVEGLNRAEKKMEEARRSGDFSLIKHWEREAAFNGAGHYLHTIFWNNMSPDGGGEPRGDIATQIKQDFSSFSRFKKHFSEAAKNVEGVGWALLVWSPRSHRLAILQAEKHQYLSQQDIVPLLVLDVWEHAYYLQYQTDRAKYVDNWWNIVNWDDVNRRFLEARTLRWAPY